MDINFYQITILVCWLVAFAGFGWLISKHHFKSAGAVFVGLILIFAANPIKFETGSVRTMEVTSETAIPIPPRVTVDTHDYKAEQQKHLSTIRNQSEEVYNEITE